MQSLAEVVLILDELCDFALNGSDRLCRKSHDLPLTKKEWSRAEVLVVERAERRGLKC
jgi:hypothetical protein